MVQNSDLTFAMDLVKEMGEQLKKEFHKGVTYNVLDHGELEIPFESEILRSYTDAIAKAYPEADIATTDNEHPTVGKAMWTVDAIDGGLNFAKGIPFFCTAVSMIADLHVQVAAVYDPIHDELFAASYEHGAFLNGKKITVSETTRLDRALIGLTAIEHHPLSISGIFQPMQERAWSVVDLPSSILSACYVAAGRFDAHLFNGRRIWDIAPSALLVTEAGGVVTDAHDRVWDPQEPIQGVVYANSDLHKQLLNFG